MTLAAKDLLSGYAGLYRKVFSEGFRASFRGATTPMVAAVPQFCCIGPVYLAAERRGLPSAVGMGVASFLESALTYFAHRRNAQIQFNAARGTAGPIAVSGVGLAYIMGPGFAWHVARNFVGMSGIRL